MLEKIMLLKVAKKQLAAMSSGLLFVVLSVVLSIVDDVVFDVLSRGRLSLLQASGSHHGFCQIGGLGAEAPQQKHCDHRCVILV